MLDQNTDRMWFVIGAVIVGAAIIFIANGTMPELFASVADSFDSVTGDITEAIHSETSNMFRPQQVVTGRWIDPSDGSLKTTANAQKYVVSNYISVQEGVTYIFQTPDESYDKRIVYFDQNKNRIAGSTRAGNHRVMESTSPAGAVFARISTRVESDVDPVRKGVPVDTWWFGKADTIKY